MSKTKSALQGRTAIVTGAGRGIGRAVARALAQQGANVIVNDIGRTPDGEATAENVAEEIRAEGGRAHPSLESVTDYDGAGRIVDTAGDVFGSADILINNAGIASSGSILEVDEAEFARVSSSHIAGAFNCTSHVVRPMVERGWGRIVNLLSRSGITGIPGSIAYAMGKGAVFGLTNGASRELGEHGITVNGVCPASTRTAMVQEAIAKMRDGTPSMRRRADSLIAQMQTPEAVAIPIVALCLESAARVNGQVFLVEHDQIGLFSPLAVTQRVTCAPGWGPEELALAIGDFSLHSLADAYGGESSGSRGGVGREE